MICNLASDISTRATVWTVTDITTGRYIQGVPTHLVPMAMRQLRHPTDAKRSVAQ